MASEALDILSRLVLIEQRLSAAELTMQGLAGILDDVFPVLNYPEPIATPLARERAATFSHEKFFSIIDAAESCIKYTSALILALALDGGDSGEDVREAFRQPLSLGSWASLARAHLPQLNEQPSEIGFQVVDSLTRRNGRPTETARYLFDELINLRNSERGHGSAQSEGAYEGLYLRHKETIYDAISSCSYLRFPLVRVEQIDFQRGRSAYDLRLLMGPSPIARTSRALIDAHVARGETCVWDQAGILVSLRGLVVHRNCECGLDHTFFLESSKGGVLSYHSYAGNHRLEDRTGTWEI